MSLPKLLILSYTDARCDPRVYRQVKYLREHFSVTLCGLGDPGFDNVPFLPIQRQRKQPLAQGFIAAALIAGNYAPAMRRFVLTDPAKAAARHFDLVLVNDLEPLPLGFTLAKGAPVVFDAHEYYPKEFENSLRWRLLFQPYLTALCGEYIPRCAAMTTVSSGIAQEYHHFFGLLPEIVHNGPDYHDLHVKAPAPGSIRLVHHGSASPDRCVERMIETMDLVDKRFSLDLYLVGNRQYLRKLQSMAQTRQNVTWRAPVPMGTLTRVGNDYDMGVFLVPPNTFNLLHCLPNKFFEFIQSRLGIAIGPSPEMAAIVTEHRLGVVAENFTPEALASRLNALSLDDVLEFKKNADQASARYNADKSMETLRGILRSVLKNSACH